MTDGASPLTRAVWYLLIFSLPFTDFLFFPETLKTAGQPSTFLIAALWLALFLEWARKRRVPLPNDAVHRPLFWFLLVAGASIGMCYRVPVAEFLGDVVWEKSLRQLGQFSLFASVFVLPYFLIRNPNEQRRAWRAFFAALGVVLAYGMLEVAAAFLDWRELAPILGAFHWGSWYEVPGDVPGVVMSSTPLGDLPRLRLVFAEPSMAANFLAVALPLLVVQAVSPSRRRWFWGGLALLASVYLVLTFSLGGYFTLLVVAGLLVVLLPGARHRLSYGVLLGTLALLLVVIPFLSDFALEVLTRPLRGELSVAVRLETVEAGLRMFLAHPWLGVGLGNSPFYIYDYLPWRPPVAPFLGWYVTHGEIALPVLNLFVRLLAETGLFGGLLFLLWHYRVLRSGWQTLRQTRDSHQRLWGVGLLVAVVAVLAGYFEESGFDKRYWPFLLGLCAAWGRISALPASVRR